MDQITLDIIESFLNGTLTLLDGHILTIIDLIYDLGLEDRLYN